MHPGQLLYDLRVTFLITGDLLRPKRGIRFGNGIIVASFVPMPETAIDEDAGTVFPEYDVGPAWQGSQGQVPLIRMYREPIR